MKINLTVILLVLFHIGWSQTLKIYHLDVGQGASTFFVSSNASGTVQKTVLFDGGLKRAGQGVFNYIKTTLGITKIDYLVASHYDSDHIGGLVYIMAQANSGNITIDSVLDRGTTFAPTTNIYTTYRGLVSGFKYKVITPGHIIDMFNSKAINLKCVAVNGKVKKKGVGTENLIASVTSPNENDLSVAFLATYGKFQYINGADIGGKKGSQPATCDGSYSCNFTDIETSIATTYFPLSIYSVNHHGSRCSLNNSWATTSKSVVAVISSGKNGRYKHPRQEVLNTLNASTELVKYYMTASVNYYSRTLGTKGILNPTAGKAVIVEVPAKTGTKPITTQSNFKVNGTNYTYN